MRSLTVGLGCGLLAGMAVTTAALASMYPDVSKRVKRDGKRAIRSFTRRTIGQMLMHH